VTHTHEEKNMVNGRSDVVDLDYEKVLQETEKAYLVQFDKEKGIKVWLAKSQCDLNEDFSVVTMKQSYAEEKEIEDYAK